MQIKYNDGRPDLLGQIDAGKVEKEMMKQLADPAVASVAVHKEGSVIDTSAGESLRVTRKGLEALTPNQRKRERKRRRRRKGRA